MARALAIETAKATQATGPFDFVAQARGFAYY